MTQDEILAAIMDLHQHDLESWCARGWVRPALDGETMEYRAVDVARVHLICEMRRDLAVNDEGIAVALDLIDQLYNTRARLHALGEAILGQPEDVRNEIESLVRRTMGG